MSRIRHMHRCLPNINLHIQLSLLAAATQFLQRITQRRDTLPPDDIVHSVPWTHLHDTIALSHSESQAPPDAPIAEGEDIRAHSTHQCPHCDFTTWNSANLRRHLTTVHDCQVLRTSLVPIHDYTTSGLPTCKHCSTTFASWTSFRRHLQRGVRHPPDQDTALMNPPWHMEHIRSLPFGNLTLTLIQRSEWTQIQQHRDICDHLNEHCILRNAWFGKIPRYLNHMRSHHPLLLKHTIAKSAQLTDAFSDHKNCSFCGNAFRGQHLCPVSTQLAKLLAHGAANTEDFPDRHIRSRLHCEICDHSAADEAALRQHLRQDHKLQARDWNLSRDSWNNKPICAHCDSNLKTIANLRAHITFGWCDSFNPSRSAETIPVDDKWAEMLHRGTILNELKKIGRAHV